MLTVPPRGRQPADGSVQPQPHRRRPQAVRVPRRTRLPAALVRSPHLVPEHGAHRSDCYLSRSQPTQLDHTPAAQIN